MPGFKAKLRAFESMMVDRVLGIATRAPTVNPDSPAPAGQVASQFADMVSYQSYSYYYNWSFIRPVKMNADDVFYDVGCGMGRILCLAALMGPGACVGIEIDPVFYEIALRNAARIGSPGVPVEIQNQDATLVDYSRGTVFFLFNPFGKRTTEAVLENIHRSLSEHPRRVRFILVNPVQHEVFAATGWLKLVGERLFIKSSNVGRPDFSTRMRLFVERTFIGGPGATRVCYYENVG